MNKNIKIMIAVICIIVLLALVAILSFVFVPKDSNQVSTLSIEMSYLRYDDEGNLQALLSYYRTKEMSKPEAPEFCYSTLQKVKYKKTSYKLTFWQSMIFVFDQDTETEERIEVAYDYASHNTYIRFIPSERILWQDYDADPWYIVSNADYLYSKLLQNCFADECSTRYVSIQRNLFLYNSSTWAKKDQTWRLTKHEIKLDGFRNIDSITISDSDDAIRRAAEELGYTSYVAKWCYDPIDGYWLVAICNNENGYEVGSQEWDAVVCKNGTVKTVIMDKNGITVEISWDNDYDYLLMSS